MFEVLPSFFALVTWYPYAPFVLPIVIIFECLTYTNVHLGHDRYCLHCISDSESY